MANRLEEALEHKSHGLKHLEFKKFDLAVDEFKKAQTLNPRDLEVAKKLGELYYNQGQVVEAMMQYRRVVEAEPTDSESRNFLATAYYELGSLDKAAAEYQKAIKHLPNNGSLYNNLAVVYCEQGKLDLAVEAFQSALRINHNDAMAHSNLGFVYQQMGKEEESKHEFMESLRLDPNEVVAHYSLGIEFEHKGEVEIGQVVKVGELLRVQPPYQMKLKDRTRAYNARVEDVDEVSVTLSAPMEAGVPVPYRPGMKLILGMPKGDALYGFFAEVMERKGGKIPTLRLSKTRNCKRIQRRRYARIDGSVPMEIDILQRVGQTQMSTFLFKKFLREKNLSAGGMLFVAPEPLTRGTLLKIDLDLPSGKISAKAEVVRTRKNSEREEYEMGVNFLNLSERDKDRIIQYIYQRQIDMKKRGLPM